MAAVPHELTCTKRLRCWIGLTAGVLAAAYGAWHERSFIRHLAHEARVHYFGETTLRPGKETPVDEMHPVLQPGEQATLRQAIRLSFCGDLILLRDAVENGYDETAGTHDFSPMFQEVSEYWKSADLAVGVFEGPMAGGERGYSTSCYGDGIPLHLNFPDVFAQNIKDAGIGLVTTANNHLLDMGEEGAMRTLDVLDSVGLDHLGSYRNAQERGSVKICMVRGKKIAFVAYTYGCNDIRYRDAARCAMTAGEYVANVDALVQEVRHANHGARFVLIAPWHSAPHDPPCKCTREEKDRLYAEYTEALQRYCRQNGLLFIDPNPYICQKRAQRFWGACMKDHIHPDAHSGIRLYSEGVVKASTHTSPPQ